MTRFTLLLAFGLLLLIGSQGSAQQGPAPGIPELEVLSSYVGRWKAKVESEGPFTRGQFAAGWILDGTFVQQAGILASADGSSSFKVTTMMTYDQNAKVYRMWVFSSNGSVSTATGTWDAEHKTMTSVQRRGPTTVKTIADFSDEGTEKWMIITTNEAGEVVSTLKGVSTRQEE